jgi:hypothetical protein
MNHKTSESDIVRLIIGEELNENYAGLQSLLNEFVVNDNSILKSINVIGYCGESPAHIAVYKNDEIMLKVFLECDADPNFKNTIGETLFHTTSKLGRFELLKLLYETGRCNLEIKDDRHQYTAVEFLENIPFNQDILISLRLYKNWSSTDPDETDLIKEGRQKCLEYLKEKQQYDREMKIVSLTKEAIDWKLQREKTRRILSGDDGIYTYQYHGPYMDYPEKEGVCQFNEFDQRFFNQYRKGIHSVATTSFSQQFYMNSMQIGQNHAEQRLIVEKQKQNRK